MWNELKPPDGADRLCYTFTIFYSPNIHPEKESLVQKRGKYLFRREIEDSFYRCKL